MSRDAVAILGLGAVTPVGLSAAATCAALRAGVPRMLPLEGWDDDGVEPPEDVVAGRVPLERLLGEPDPEWPGFDRWSLPPPAPQRRVTPDARRLVELAVPAAEEAWADARAPRGRLGLYLGLDERDAAEPLADAVAGALGVAFEVTRADRLGRAAGLAALHRAARHLREERVDVALVGGVDSLIRRDRLRALDDAGALKHGGEAAGIIPGEAAAFLVLTRAGASRARAHVLGSAVAEEPTAGGDEPNQGVGLTRALRRAVEAAGTPPAYPWVVSDLNGDRDRPREWVYAGLRALAVHNAEGGPRHVDAKHPADCVGDCGAASGALNAVWAVTALHQGYARIGHALVWGASDGPLRAVAVIARGEDYGD